MSDLLEPTNAAILDAALKFRAAIDAIGPDPWAKQGHTFPRGACAHAAELLARYLIERFGIQPVFVSQSTEVAIDGWTGGHAWLEWDGLVIDITGDQFKWAPVIVTRTSASHGRGQDLERRLAGLPELKGWWGRHCAALWTAICVNLSPCDIEN